MVFFSLEDLNEAIWVLLEKLNDRPFQKLEGTRRSLFEQLDRPAMRELPAHRYELARWKKAGVNIDYHVEYDHRYYSVPHPLTQQKVEVRATVSTVEVFHRSQRVASHERSYGPRGTAVTDERHRPRSHRDYGNWPPSRLVGWAETVGPHVAEVVRQVLKSRPHPEQGYRSCMALMRDAKKHGPTRTDAACRRALAIGSPTRKSVEAILKARLEMVPVEDERQQELPVVVHENVRGGDYYDTDQQQPKEKANP
jgi:transposase